MPKNVAEGCRALKMVFKSVIKKVVNKIAIFNKHSAYKFVSI